MKATRVLWILSIVATVLVSPALAEEPTVEKLAAEQAEEPAPAVGWGWNDIFSQDRESLTDNWLGRHFFSGGIMPSASLLTEVPSPLEATAQWAWNGTHYEKTANAWLENFDRAHAELMPVFERAYGTADAARWFRRWRVFFMACAELWGYADGREWFVSHYLFEPRKRGSCRATTSKGEAA